MIREAVIQDAENISKISTNSLGYPCEAGLVMRRLLELDAGNEKVFVAVEDDQVVGFVHAELYQLLYHEDLVNVLGLAVSNDFQRKGHGKMLMRLVEAWAKEMNCAAVRLNSAANRKGAHLFYEGLGYQNTKSQKRFIKTLRRSIG